MSDEKVRAKRWTKNSDHGSMRVFFDETFGFVVAIANSEREAADFIGAHNADADRMNAYAERLEIELDEARRGLASRADKCCERQKLSLHAEVERLKRELANWRTRAEAAEGKLADNALAQSFDAPAPPAPKELKALMWLCGTSVVAPCIEKPLCGGQEAWAVGMDRTDALGLTEGINESIRAAYALGKAERERLRELLSERDAAIERLEADLGEAEAAKPVRVDIRPIGFGMLECVDVVDEDDAKFLRKFVEEANAWREKAEAANDDGRRWRLVYSDDGGLYMSSKTLLSRACAEEFAKARNLTHPDCAPIEARPVEPKRWRLRIAGVPMGKSYETKAGAETEAGVLLRNWGIEALVEEVSE